MTEVTVLKILAFETSAKAASVALWDDGILLAEYFQNSGQTHSRTVMKMAQDMLENCDLTPGDLEAVACAVGPGSFTGIRIGVAAAKGFCWGGDLPLCGVSTLEGMAYGAGVREGIICCAMDARRSQVYNALFLADNGTLSRLCEDRAISLEELQADLAHYDGQVYLVGDGAKLCADTLTGKELYLMPEHLRQQRAGGIALAAAEMIRRGQLQDAAYVVPNYLRLSQAERERLARLAAQPEPNS